MTKQAMFAAAAASAFGLTVPLYRTAVMAPRSIIDGVEMQQKLRSRQQRQQRQQFNQYGGGQPVQPGRPGDADGGAEEGDAATQHRFKLGSFDLKSKLLQFNLLIKYAPRPPLSTAPAAP